MVKRLAMPVRGDNLLNEQAQGLGRQELQHESGAGAPNSWDHLVQVLLTAAPHVRL